MPFNSLQGHQGAGQPIESPSGAGIAVATDGYCSICPDCRQHFTPTKKTQVYCSEECRVQAWDRENPRLKKASAKQLELALKARDKGVERVKGKNSEFVRAMRQAAVMLAKARPDKTITADDLREWHNQNPQIGEPTTYNAWGAVFCRNPDFEFMGYTKSTQIQGHGNILRRWRLVDNDK